MSNFDLTSKKVIPLFSSKINFPFLLILMLLILDSSFFSLIDTNSINFFGISYLDIFMFIKLVVVFFYFLSYYKKMRICILGSSILCFALLITSSYAANNSFGQSFVETIVAQRYWASSIFCLIPILIMLKKKQITVQQVIKAAYIVSTLIVAIGIVQFILKDTIDFTHTMNENSERFGEARYYFEYSLVCLTGLHSFGCLFKKYSLRHFVYWLLVIVFLAVVCKYRMTSIAFIIGSFSIILLPKINLRRKLAFALFFALFFVLFLNTNFGKDIVVNIFDRENSLTNTLGIRELGRAYYFDFLLSSFDRFLFGSGVANIHNNNAQIISGSTSGFFVEDNGLFGITFEYGLFGLVSSLIIYCLLFIKSIKEVKRSKTFWYFGFLVYDMIGFVTIIPSFWRMYLTFSLFMALLFFEEQEHREKTIS